MHNFPTWLIFILANIEWVAGFVVGLTIIGLGYMTWKITGEDDDAHHSN